MDKVDQNWASIKAFHGMVAIDHAVAAARTPPTLQVPSDPPRSLLTRSVSLFALLGEPHSNPPRHSPSLLTEQVVLERPCSN